MPSTVLLVLPAGLGTAEELVDRLKDDAWTVLIARGEEQAGESIRTSPAVLLLVDSEVWDQPSFREMVGREAASLPVIVLTRGDEGSDALVKHLKLGAASFVPRRASSRELKGTIRSVIDLSTRNPYRERVKEFLKSGQIEMKLDNDPANIGAAVGFLQSLMDGYDVCDEKTRVRLGIALSEAISNAMIHGNLEVDSAGRAENADGYFEAIERRRKESPYAEREVHLLATIGGGELTFVVRDEGPGFQPEALPDPTDPENLMRLCGRGVLMMRAYADSVTWNERGNEVVLAKKVGSRPKGG
jgi:anti-sigma regulatory factor (Ser/Thr protein kinase)